jgi:hypothetical protein
MDSLAKTVEVLRLHGDKYVVESILAGRQTFSSSLFPGWEITLDQLFRFPVRP